MERVMTGMAIDCGPDVPPLPRLTIGEMLDAAVADFGGCPASGFSQGRCA